MITAIITSFNEEIHIAAAIESLSWADEIILVDSFSTDQTVEIAKQYSVKILQHHYEYPAAQKNWAIPQAKYDWVFILDADERVSPELAREVKAIVAAKTDVSAFWIGRINYYMGKKVRYSDWQGDKVIRLFRKENCAYADVLVHEEVVTNGKVGRLKGKLEHYTYKGIDAVLEKIDRYTSWAAREKAKKTKKVGYFHLLFKPLFKFIQSYFFKLGFLDGKVGFILCCFHAYYIFLRSVKIKRILEGEEI